MFLRVIALIGTLFFFGQANAESPIATAKTLCVQGVNIERIDKVAAKLDILLKSALNSGFNIVTAPSVTVENNNFVMCAIVSCAGTSCPARLVR